VFRLDQHFITWSKLRSRTPTFVSLLLLPLLGGFQATLCSDELFTPFPNELVD
jgi:hypothetical protein